MSETQYSIISLLPAFIWAIVPLFYKEFLNNNSTIKVNFYRMLFASLALFIPFLYLGFNEGIIFGMLSGILTLAIGDSFYLLSIRKVGASIAAPVSYTYVFFSQIAAFVLGEKISYLYFISSILIVFGIFLLTGSDKTKIRFLGVLIALSASLFWTLGQSMIKLATVQDMNPISIAFTRVASACLSLAILTIIKERNFSLNANLRKKIMLGIASISDLALGSSIFILSIALAGLGITIIVTSLSPLITQIFAKLSGREKPLLKDVLGGIMIVIAVIIILL